MRAVQLHKLKAPLRGFDVDDPMLSSADVRVRVEACGICHSDAHYRSGFGGIGTPRTLGHEIAGVVIEVGSEVRQIRVGDRVAIHYLRSCGNCRSCLSAGEQFCERGEMIGKHCDGGYAEQIVVPEANAIPVPANVPMEVAAVAMCSTATAYHALRLAHLTAGQTVVILGLGGLGTSAVQLSRTLGASLIAGVDVVPEKLEAAEAIGVHAIDGRSPELEKRLRSATEGYGFDVAVDFTGNADLCRTALKALAPKGTLVLVALSQDLITFNPYLDVLGKERRIIGCSDHLRSELVDLLTLIGDGRLKLDAAISRRVPLEAEAINHVLDELEQGTRTVRTVIVPNASTL